MNNMSTVSLRKDHELIEKVIKAMESTIQLLKIKNKFLNQYYFQ